MDSTIIPSALRYWQVSRAVKAAGTLGLPDLDRIATKRWMLLIPHAFHFDRKNVLVTVKTGWADWLKVALPLNVNGPDSMSSRDLDKSIYDQATALHKSDGSLHAEPVTRKSSKSSKSATTPTPKTPATPPVPLPKTPLATPPVAPPVPSPGQFVAPPVNPYHALLSDLMSADTVKRQQMVTLIGKAILATKDDEAILTLWEVISADVERIELANVPKLHANVA